MVCDRCIKVVKEELESIGNWKIDVQLGKAIISFTDEEVDLQLAEKVLKKNGFELLLDKNSQLVEHVKTLIIDLIYKGKMEHLNRNLSEIISTELGKDYSFISNLFSYTENITIEKFVILQKIERVKELLSYGELTLSEITFQLGYSSVQHLSGQFKKVTGLTPSKFRSLKSQNRTPINRI
jgi:AraC family transcriptional regulator